MKRFLWILTVLIVASVALTACPAPATPAPAPAAQATKAPAAATAAPAAATKAPEATKASAATAAPAATKAPEATKAPAATAAPAGSPTPKPTATFVPAKKGQITIWYQWDNTYFDAIKQVFTDYQTSHPGTNIVFGKPDDVTAALKVAVPAGEGPDIIAWANDNIGTQALIGNIVPLESYGIDMTFLKSTYEPAAVNGVVYQGKIFALPETQEAIALVYNKKLMTDQYLPKDPKNLDDLLAKAKAYFTDKSGQPLFCNQGLGGSDPYHEAPVYFGSGMPSYVDDQGKVYLNTPAGIKAATWINSAKAYLPKEASYDICKSMFTEGKTAAWWTGPWAIADIEKAKIDYGILPMGSPFVGIKTLMLTRNAVDRGNDKAAIDLMKYFTSADVQKKLALINKTIPAQSAALKDPQVAALNTLASFGASANLGVPMANTPYAQAQWSPVGDATMAVWTGKQTPQDAMAAAQKAIESAIAQMK